MMKRGRKIWEYGNIRKNLNIRSLSAIVLASTQSFLGRLPRDFFKVTYQKGKVKALILV